MILMNKYSGPQIIKNISKAKLIESPFRDGSKKVKIKQNAV